MTPIILIIALLAIVFFIYRSISQQAAMKLNALEKQRINLIQRYEFMREQRKTLKAEVSEKERQLTTLRNNESGLRTISASDLDIDEVDDNEKLSRYLIQEGKISLEQNEKVLRKMETLQMDYLGVCLTLGLIDIKTAQRAIKINKIKTKSQSLQ